MVKIELVGLRRIKLMKMKNLKLLLLSIILIKVVGHNNLKIQKHIRVSTENSKNQFKVLKIERL